MRRSEAKPGGSAKATSLLLAAILVLASLAVLLPGSPGCRAAGEPHIDSLSGTLGRPGDIVNIVGTNFDPDFCTVDFGIWTADVSYASETLITCTVPEVMGTAVYDVTVQTLLETSNALPFTVIAHNITDIYPDSAMPGATVTLLGSDFGDSQGGSRVTFNGVPAAGYSEWHDYSIDCLVPALGPGPVSVKVVVLGYESNAFPFTVLDHTHSIISVSPGSGWPGTEVTIMGNDFSNDQGASYVLFGDTPVTACSYWGNSMIECEVPGMEAGATAVTVVIDGVPCNGLPFEVEEIPPNSEWYLPEGSTAWGFDTYITIANPNNQMVTATVTYMLPDGSEVTDTAFLPAASQTTISPGDKLGEQDFSTKITSVDRLPIAVDRTMQWQNEAGIPEMHSSIGVPAPALEWYLPEGSSNWGFETFLLIQNPNAVPAECDVTYMIEGGGPVTVRKTVGPSTRATFNMAADIASKDASIRVTSNVPVIPERAMYRNSRREGHDSIGTTEPAEDYFLAEGTTGWGFTTFVLVQNPQETETRVDVTYMTPNGAVAHPENPIVMPPNSRRTINVNGFLPDSDFSTRVHGSQPIIAERAMYWGGDTGFGEACHDSIGMSAPHMIFYLPDGDTTVIQQPDVEPEPEEEPEEDPDEYELAPRGGQGEDIYFETWTLVQNPNPAPVSVRVSYLLANGGVVDFTDTIPGNSRKTYPMADHVQGGRAAIVVVSLSQGLPVMAERAMYVNVDGYRVCGTDTIGGYSD